jgi:hypothetical protein
MKWARNPIGNNCDPSGREAIRKLANLHFEARRVIEGDGQPRDEQARTRATSKIRFVSISSQAGLIHLPIPDYTRMQLADRDKAPFNHRSAHCKVPNC